MRTKAMEPVFTYGDISVTLVEIFAGLALILVSILITLYLSRRASRMWGQHIHHVHRQQAELQGRLSQMAEESAKRELMLRESLDQRLDNVSERVGKSIVETQERNSENLKQLHERLALIDRAQKNIETLSGEVSGLQNLLSNKQARGAFGEKQMQDLISDYLPPKTYSFQATLSNRKRVDALIHMPGDQGDVAIDSKFPLESWRRLMEVENSPEEDMARRDFARDVQGHIKDIAEKYLIFGETHDVAMMFLPSEAIYAELHTHFPKVIEAGFKQKVMIVSPTTFMATLHTMRAVMKDAAMREQAHIIQKEVGLMAKDVALLDTRVAKLQQHFDQSTEDMRQIRISTGKITKRADKIDAIEDHMDQTEPTNIADFRKKA